MRIPTRPRRRGVTPFLLGLVLALAALVVPDSTVRSPDMMLVEVERAVQLRGELVPPGRRADDRLGGASAVLTGGGASATAWGCDLTYEYVRINGSYRT